jgi:hypothetical protein
MNGIGIYSVQYFPTKTEWVVTRLFYDGHKLNHVYYYSGEFKLEEYCIYLESVDDVPAFVIGASKIEVAIKERKKINGNLVS